MGGRRYLEDLITLFGVAGNSSIDVISNTIVLENEGKFDQGLICFKGWHEGLLNFNTNGFFLPINIYISERKEKKKEK